MGKKATEGSDPRSHSPERATNVELILTDELARGDTVLRGVPPVLTHMLASSGHTLVSEAIVARLRGMLNSVAGQLLSAKAGSAKPAEEAGELDQLADRLTSDSALLSYCYSLAMEGRLAERLEQRASLDPILSPLMQELIASENPEIAELAMNALAAQSRFVQSQRRMELPLSELPAELFHAVLKRWATMGEGDPEVGPAIAQIKARYDEGASRVGLLARLIASMKGGAIAALELDHAGLAMFVGALSRLAKQPRELAILACHERQAARLALSLRAAGLSTDAIDRQFNLLEPADRLPAGIGSVDPNRAAAILKRANSHDAT